MQIERRNVFGEPGQIERRNVFGKPGRSFAAIFVLILAPACRGGDAGVGPEDKPKPIPECQDYERAVSECAQRDISLASQTALATTRAERAELTQLCVTNLHRIREACR